MKSEFKTEPSCSDPSVMVSADASEKTKELWWLHGHPHSARYSNPKLNTLGVLVKHNAEDFHDRVAFMYPASDKADTVYLPVTWNQFHRITDRLAMKYGHLLRKEIANGRSNLDQPTIALLGGGTTLEYFSTQIALQKLNLRVLLLADRSLSDVVQTLIATCHAVAVVYDLRNADVVLNGVRKVPMIERLVLHDDGVLEDKIGQLRFEDNCDPWERHAFVLHSSGSTGPPKAIVHTNRSMMLIARMYRLFPDFHIENWFLLFPLYHIAGISTMLSGLPNGLITSLPPRSWPPPASSILQACENLALSIQPVDCIHCAPIIIENLYDYITKTNNDFSQLSSLKVLQPGGAKLSETLISCLVGQHVNIKTTYGSTEIGPAMRSIPHNKDNPKCYSLRTLYPDNSKFEMQDVGGGLYECIVHKGFDIAAELWSEDDKPYRTNDLFKQEPPGSGNFVLQGRRDDFLVHSDGNNTSAGALQLDIQAADPNIKNVLAVGHSRPCVGLLVELKPGTGTHRDVALEDLWVGIQKVNKNYPRHSQVLRSMIYVLPSDVMLPVTPKGNVKRNEVATTFKDIINGMYDELLGDTGNHDGSRINDRGSVLQLLRDLVSTVFDIPTMKIRDTTSFYQIGMDSLSALQLRSSISTIMGNVSLGTIFENPSIDQLTDYFLRGKREVEKDKHISSIDRLIAKYTSDFFSWPNLPATSNDCGGIDTVLLTGASGSLGLALLEILSASLEVSKIVALVRGPNGYAKLHKSLENRGMDSRTVLESEKLEILEYSMKDPLLGLDIDTYHRLSKAVTTVLHCAWKVNFNLTMEDFEDDCLRGTMALIRFCYTGTRKIFAFTSSVSACMGKGFKGSEVPEEPLGDDPTVAMETGYAQSKFIAERVIEGASDCLGIRSVLLRVGQLCGHSKRGCWSREDMYPIMFAASALLKAVPTFRKREVDWLPVDTAAETIRDLLARGKKLQGETCTVYQIVHPRPTSWKMLVRMLQESQIQETGEKFEEVTMSTWVERLRTQSNIDDKTVGLKLLGFFEVMSLQEDATRIFLTDKSCLISPALSSCPTLKSSWLPC